MIVIDYKAVLVDLEVQKIKIESAIAAVRNLQGLKINPAVEQVVRSNQAAEGSRPFIQEGAEGRVAQCRSCKAKIIWMKTSKGKNIPVDYAPSIAKAKVFVYGTMKAHFNTCPNANQHRKGDNEG